jgi:hypothetical protein
MDTASFAIHIQAINMRSMFFKQVAGKGYKHYSETVNNNI